MQLLAAKRFWHRFDRDRAGATSIEYAMIAGGISVAIIVGVQAVGTTVTTKFYAALTGMF